MSILKKQNSLFFWKIFKSKEPAMSKQEQMVQTILKYLPEIKKALRRDNHDTDGVPMDSEGNIVGRMYDFYRNWNDTISTQWDDPSPSDTPDGNPAEAKKDNRIVATPLSVMSELETVPTPFTCDNLDEKIETLKDKNKLMNQRYAGEQIKGLIKRLENRKQYEAEHEFYNAFPNTTDAKIDKLLEKYMLVMKTSDLFIPTFPKDAIDIMKKYSEVTERITGETPVFYVIAEEKDFKKKDEKLDPILLVQSPFGFFWQILGAWDKEMLLLSEL